MDLAIIEKGDLADIEVKEIDKEFEEAQQNIRDLIERGFETLDALKTILDGSDHPQAALVLSSTIKTIADLNKDLMALRKSKLENTAIITGGNKQDNPPGQQIENQQNNIYIGTSDDLQKLLKGMNTNG